MLAWAAVLMVQGTLSMATLSWWAFTKSSTTQSGTSNTGFTSSMSVARQHLSQRRSADPTHGASRQEFRARLARPIDQRLRRRL